MLFINKYTCLAKIILSFVRLPNKSILAFAFSNYMSTFYCCLCFNCDKPLPFTSSHKFEDNCCCVSCYDQFEGFIHRCNTIFNGKFKYDYKCLLCTEQLCFVSIGPVVVDPVCTKCYDAYKTMNSKLTNKDIELITVNCHANDNDDIIDASLTDSEPNDPVIIPPVKRKKRKRRCNDEVQPSLKEMKLLRRSEMIREKYDERNLSSYNSIMQCVLNARMYGGVCYYRVRWNDEPLDDTWLQDHYFMTEYERALLYSYTRDYGKHSKHRLRNVIDDSNIHLVENIECYTYKKCSIDTYMIVKMKNQDKTVWINEFGFIGDNAQQLLKEFSNRPDVNVPFPRLNVIPLIQ